MSLGFLCRALLSVIFEPRCTQSPAGVLYTLLLFEMYSNTTSPQAGELEVEILRQGRKH